MNIETVPSGPIETNAYLVADSGRAMVIDPSKDSFLIIGEMLKENSLKLELVVDTHGHWDHIADNSSFKKAGGKIVIHREDEGMIKNPVSKMFRLPFVIEPTAADMHMEEGTTIELGSLRFRVLHTPGHTLGGCCLYEESKKIIFTGDTLFAGTHGRTDFEGGDPEKMIASLKRLSKLPSDTVVYPGHGPSTTIGNEKWLKRL